MMKEKKTRFVGRRAKLFTADHPIERINSSTLLIGVQDKSIAKKFTVNKVVTTADRSRQRLLSVKSRANKRGYEFDLTPEFIADLLEQPCVYCNQYEIPQLDRKDNLKGYTTSNVVPACKRCNTVKSMYLSYDEMITVAKALGWRE